MRAGGKRVYWGLPDELWHDFSASHPPAAAAGAGPSSHAEGGRDRSRAYDRALAGAAVPSGLDGPFAGRGVRGFRDHGAGGVRVLPSGGGFVSARGGFDRRAFRIFHVARPLPGGAADDGAARACRARAFALVLSARLRRRGSGPVRGVGRVSWAGARPVRGVSRAAGDRLPDRQCPAAAAVVAASAGAGGGLHRRGA